AREAGPGPADRGTQRRARRAEGRACHVGTPRIAAKARKYRSRHARRARPVAAQLRRSARAHAAPQATLIAPGAVATAATESPTRTIARSNLPSWPGLPMSARQGVFGPIRFRLAAISA